MAEVAVTSSGAATSRTSPRCSIVAASSLGRYATPTNGSGHSSPARLAGYSPRTGCLMVWRLRCLLMKSVSSVSRRHSARAQIARGASRMMAGPCMSRDKQSKGGRGSASARESDRAPDPRPVTCQVRVLSSSEILLGRRCRRTRHAAASRRGRRPPRRPVERRLPPPLHFQFIPYTGPS